MLNLLVSLQYYSLESIFQVELLGQGDNSTSEGMKIQIHENTNSYSVR